MDRGMDAPALRRQLAAEIREGIDSGAWQPGDRLPSAAELADAHGCHKSTAHAALDVLAAEGRVIRIQRVGTVVTGDQPIRVEELPGPVQIAARMPSADERAQLDIPPGIPLLVAVRASEGRYITEQFLADRTVLEIA
jgi:DNA-binding GntR family transcriptional regulator